MKAIISLVAGAVITVITGIINVTGTLIGATNYGLPLAWLTTPVIATPVTQIIWVNFIVDVIVWSAVAFLVMHFLKR